MMIKKKKKKKKKLTWVKISDLVGIHAETINAMKNKHETWWAFL